MHKQFGCYVSYRVGVPGMQEVPKICGDDAPFLCCGGIEGMLPTSHCRASSVVKSGSEQADVCNYRPLSLSTVLLDRPTVDHDTDILIRTKLSFLCFCDKALSWMNSFFTGRTQRVLVGDQYSGVHGSQLPYHATTLFTLHTADVLIAADKVSTLIHADDSLYSATDNWLQGGVCTPHIVHQ